MKKLILTTLVCLSMGIAYALPLGNPSEASLFKRGVLLGASQCNKRDPCCFWFDAWNVRLGYYGDFVFNRNLKIDGEGLDQGEDIEITQIFTNAGYLVLNLCDKLDIFGTLGASRIHIISNDV